MDMIRTDLAIIDVAIKVDEIFARIDDQDFIDTAQKYRASIGFWPVSTHSLLRDGLYLSADREKFLGILRSADFTQKQEEFADNLGKILDKGYE